MAIAITRTAWTDDDGSGTTGTVINNAVKTELYNQIDAILNATRTQHLLFTDNTYDIGASGATRPRDVYIARYITAGSDITCGGNGKFAGGYLNAGVKPTDSVTGDISASRSTTTGVLWLGSDATLYIYRAGATDLRLVGCVLTISNLASGDLTSVSGVVTSSSDECLKDVRGPLPYGLAEVARLRPILYDWREDSGMSLPHSAGGFGAQQVESVMPLAVFRGKDETRSLDTRTILGAVVNAIQELNAKVQTLEARG